MSKNNDKDKENKGLSDELNKIHKKRRFDETDDIITQESILNQVKSELEREKQHSQKLSLVIMKLESKIEKLSDQLEILNKSIINLQNEKKDLFDLLKNKEKQKAKKAKLGAKNNSEKKKPQNKTTRNTESTNEREMSDDSVGDNRSNDSSEPNETLSPSHSNEMNSATQRIMGERGMENETVNSSVYTDANTNDNDNNLHDSDDDTDTEDEHELKSETFNQMNKIKRSNKIPPIDIWTENRAEIQRIIQANFQPNSCVFGRVNNGKFRVFPKNCEVRDSIIEFIKERSYQFNTYTPSDSKMINIIMKGLDHIDDQSIIEEELARRGIVPFKVEKYITGYMRKNHVKSNIWLVVLQPNTDTKALFEIRIIDQAIVKFEFLKKPKIIQCKRCQRFNHSASNCNLPYRCVKCTKEHEPGNCSNDKDVNKFKPKCVNCQGNHTANDAKNCPVFQKILAKKDKKEKKTEPNIKMNKFSSFADAIKFNKNNTVNNQKISSNPLDSLVEQQNIMMRNFMNSMLQMQKNFVESFSNRNNGQRR